jgi:hypothetical protein
MLNPRSRADREIHNFLLAHLTNKYEIHYKNHFVQLEHFNLKIDFILKLKEEYVVDPERPIIYYIQNGRNASLRKLAQIYDLLLSFTSVSVILDIEDIQEKLTPLIQKLNDIANINSQSILSQGLQFLMFCDEQDESEIEHYKAEVCYFLQSLKELEQIHGCEDEDEDEEEVEKDEDTENFN